MQEQNNMYSQGTSPVSGNGYLSPSGGGGNKWKMWTVAMVGILVVATFGWFFIKKGEDAKKGKPIDVEPKQQEQQEVTGPLNTGNVSPITGIACENWNRRPMAVMQPADITARPAAGFSEADMVIEMPVITASITRLMGIYICGDPEDVGSMRSSRHDYIALAKGFDAIFVHWGGSHFAKEKLDEGVIDNINCNNDGGKSGGQCCYRKEGMARGVDSGYAKFSKLLECAKDFGYRTENKFIGYSHQSEAPESERPKGGHLRVGFAGAYAAEYDYDSATNSFLRTWGDVQDTDRNNNKRIAPKNIVVMMAKSEQIEGQYNNVQIGDPWYDQSDSGEAFYYFNGKEHKGTWKKDKSSIDSKLFFMDETGKEVKFVPGQIWVEVLEPGQALRWTAGI
jgi:hypothetical protein